MGRRSWATWKWKRVKVPLPLKKAWTKKKHLERGKRPMDSRQGWLKRGSNRGKTHTGPPKQPAANLRLFFSPKRETHLIQRGHKDCLNQMQINYRKEGILVLFSVFNVSKDNLQGHLLGPVLHHSSTDKSLTRISSIMVQNILGLMRRGFSLTFSPVKGFLKLLGAGFIASGPVFQLSSPPHSLWWMTKYPPGQMLVG